MALREDVGAVVAARSSAIPVAGRSSSASIVVPHGAAVPADAGRASTASTGCCASRSPASASSGPSCASRTRPSASPTANADLTDDVAAGRPADGARCSRPCMLSSTCRASPCCGSAPTGSTRGELQIGSLIAFLSYLMQILMAVMMATFMVIDDPAGRGVRRPHRRGARHRRRRSCRRPTRSPSVAEHGTLELRDVGFHYPGAEHAGAARHLVPRRRRARPRRSSAAPARARPRSQPRPAAVRRHRRRGARRRRRRPRARPRRCCGARIGLVPQRPYLFSGTVACNLRYGKPDATDDELWDGARDRPGRATSCEAMPERARRADRAGRHQRLRRPAPAAGDRPGAGAPARDLPVRRLVLGARPRHRRPAAGRAAAATPRDADGGDRRPAGVDDQSTPTRSSCSRTARIVGLRHPRRAARRPARPTPRSSSPSSATEEAA